MVKHRGFRILAECAAIYQKAIASRLFWTAESLRIPPITYSACTDRLSRNSGGLKSGKACLGHIWHPYSVLSIDANIAKCSNVGKGVGYGAPKI